MEGFIGILCFVSGNCYFWPLILSLKCQALDIKQIIEAKTCTWRF